MKLSQNVSEMQQYVTNVEAAENLKSTGKTSGKKITVPKELSVSNTKYSIYLNKQLGLYFVRFAACDTGNFHFCI